MFPDIRLRGQASAPGPDSTAASGASGEPSAPAPNDAHVIVAGGGAAGLCAALAAASRGKSVILLEKTASLGGSAALSSGMLAAAGTKQQAELGIEDSASQMARDILRASHYSVQNGLVYTASENSAGTVEWLEQFGVEFSLVTDYLHYGHSNYRMHAPADGGRGLISKLAQAVEGSGRVTVLMSTPVVGLIEENGEVAGVYADSPEKGRIALRAENTVLATGGFAANKEMLREYMPEISHAYLDAAVRADGEGIKWGRELGAATANMGSYSGSGLYGVDYRAEIDPFILYRGGILVNQKGERFVNEHTGGSELAPHVLAQPGFYAYLVFDSANAALTPDIPDYIEKDVLDVAGSIEELAALLEIEPQKLRSTVDDYVSSFAAGQDRFNRALLPESFEPPFYAVKVTSAIYQTQGGLVTDIAGHVLRPDGSLIKGLLACGGAAWGFSDSEGPGYTPGSGLLQALTLGRLAGEHAASGNRADARLVEYKGLPAS